MNNLEQLLGKLQLSKERGVIFCPKKSRWFGLDSNIFSFEILNRLNTINPDAIYHFNNRPYILFFDRSDVTENQNTEDTKIFDEVWSWDFVPLVFIVYRDSDKVYNAFNYQKKTSKRGLEEISFENKEDKYKVFSFWELQSGNSWKWLEDKVYKKGRRNFLRSQRVGQRLFDNIKYARKKLEQLFPYPEFINVLILRLIFIRYLIDRGVDIEEIYIVGNTKSERRASLNKLIGNKKQLINFFNYLEERFNGNLFETKTDPEIPDNILQVIQLFFSDKFLDKNNASLFYFDVFDFSMIPVEVISGIYENVIDEKKRKEDSAVYTPLFLADYILTNTIDKYLEKHETCKVLDPSCGSGIFLSQAYRRLVEKEKKQGTINDKKLIEIAQKNIFGIDRDINALHVAAFSVYISILDYKKPKEIKSFRLPKLIGKNLFRNDFFNEDDDIQLDDGIVTHPYNRKLKTQNLNFIIGNPPWSRKNDKDRDVFHLKYCEKMGDLITNFEISQSFLIRAKDFSSSETRCSLIVSSSAFYNSEVFKKYFFKEFLVESILDLSAVRNIVFQDAKAPCIVITYKFAFFKNIVENKIHHYSIKPNRFLKNYRIIVIDNVDIKSIPQKYFLKYDWFFKVALFGNTLDYLLIERLFSNSNIKNIKTLLEEYGTTITSRNGISKGTPLKYFPFLENLPLINTKGVKPFYTLVDEGNSTILTKEDTYLERGRIPSLFYGDHILIKRRTKTESDLVISFVEDTIVFKDSIYAFSSTQEKKLLKRLYGLFISDLFTYFQFLISSKWGVSTRPELVFKDEFVLMPYIFIEDKKFLNSVDRFLDVYRKYYSSTLKSPSSPQPRKLTPFKFINDIVNQVYQISPIEKDLIDYVLNISRYQFQESKISKISRKPSHDELRAYAQIFYDYFSTIYNEEDEYFKIEIYPSKYFTAIKFLIVTHKPDNGITFGQSLEETELFKTLGLQLSIYELSKDLFVQKNIRGYEEDFFFIIKPNEYKCWHKAIAHHDLMEFKTEMYKAENSLLLENYE